MYKLYLDDENKEKHKIINFAGMRIKLRLI